MVLEDASGKQKVRILCVSDGPKGCDPAFQVIWAMIRRYFALRPDHAAEGRSGHSDWMDLEMLDFMLGHASILDAWLKILPKGKGFLLPLSSSLSHPMFGNETKDYFRGILSGEV